MNLNYSVNPPPEYGPYLEFEVEVCRRPEPGAYSGMFLIGDVSYWEGGLVPAYFQCHYLLVFSVPESSL